MTIHQAHRSLTSEFENDLLDGMLSPLLEWIRNDNTLVFAIRKNYVDVYYRGGKLFNIKSSKQGYTFGFDKNYFKPAKDSGDFKIEFLSDAESAYEESIKSITDQASAQMVTALIPSLKQSIDFKLTSFEKNEREFQQEVFRVNSFARKANDTECFITDIEYSLDTNTKRSDIDMTGIFWDASQRKNLDSWQPVIVEMKYGEGALDGNAGVVSHLQDLANISEIQIEELKASSAYQFNLLKKLSLLKVNQEKDIEISKSERPIIIFLFAASNPRATKLANILNELEPSLLEKIDSKFDLRFYQSHLAGYEIHGANLLTLDEVKALLSK